MAAEKAKSILTGLETSVVSAVKNAEKDVEKTIVNLYNDGKTKVDNAVNNLVSNVKLEKTDILKKIEGISSSVLNILNICKDSKSEVSSELNNILKVASVSLKKLEDNVKNSTVKLTKLALGKYKLLPRPSMPDKRDWKVESIYPADKKASLPESIDYTPYLPPVFDQGNLGSCVACTSKTIKEFQERLEAEKKGKTEFKEPMSARFVYNNREDTLDEGMTCRDALGILKKYGCCTEKTFPYESTQLSDKIPDDVYKEAGDYKISGYASVNTVDGLKTALFTNGCAMISFPVYNYDSKFWRSSEKGQEPEGYHCVTVVGYSPTDGFKIRNTWGSDWGNGGYTVFPFEDFGLQSEIWTSVDANSYTSGPPVNPFAKPIINGCCVIA